MQAKLLSLIFLFFTLHIASSQIIGEHSIGGNGNIRVVGTPRGTYDPMQRLLTDGHQSHQIRLQDMENSVNFNVIYYFKEFKNGTSRFRQEVQEISSAGFSSVNARHTNVMTITRTPVGHLAIFNQTPGERAAVYIFATDNEHFKWQLFPETETPFAKRVPVWLVFNESADEDTLEKRVAALFESPAFQELKEIDEMVEQIQTVLHHFYIYFYDVIPRQADQ